MLSLKQIQLSLTEAIYQNDEQILAEIKSSEIENTARLQIYKDNVLITLYESLKSTYPAICKLVGEQFFKYATHEYIKNNKPISGNLDEYGENFINFLAELSATKELKYLPDIARLEWAVHTAYFAADVQKINAVALSKISPEQLENLKFELHPSTQIISSIYPIDKIWQMTQEDSEESSDIDITERGADVLVIRPDLKTQVLLLENGEAAFLNSIENGDSLYKAFEKALIINANFNIGSAIQKFSLNGTFVGFTPTQ
jgi:hypothetical protein